MATQFVTSFDGTRIAYEVYGQGPAVMLLHGAGKTRQDWVTAGYINRLSQAFTVIAVDLRGMGDSQVRTEPVDYAIDRLCDDLCAVAEGCGVQRFAVWGYSLGGSLARYLAVRSKDVNGLIVVGAPLNQVDNPRLNLYVDGFIEKWRPIVEAYKAGQLDSQDQEALIKSGALVWSAFFPAMRLWPEMDLGTLRCPVLLVVGEADQDVIAWVNLNRSRLDNSQVKVEIVAGINHEQEFMEIEKIYPLVESFLSSPAVS